MVNLEVSEKLEPIPTVKIKGEVDHFNCPRVESVVRRLLDDGVMTLIIDLSELAYLDTAGVAMIFWTAKRLYDRQGQLRLVLPPGDVRRILEIAGIGSLPATTVYDNVNDALA